MYVTLGTRFADPGIMRTLVDGLGGLPVDVLVAGGPRIDAADLGELPGNVTVAKWVPQAEILSQVDVIVHHGGSGTSLGAAVHAIPQLIVPLGADQDANAAQLARLGCAVRVSSQGLDGAAIAGHVQAILSGSAIGRAAASLAAEIAGLPSPADTITRLVGLSS